MLPLGIHAHRKFMTQIGLLSDTHGFLDQTIFAHFDKCDEIWHAGDVGTAQIVDQLRGFKPVRAVFGNIDSPLIRSLIPENQFFDLEGFRIWMTHIGGAPPNYNPAIKRQFKDDVPDIFICGHSHILRVLRDQKLDNMWYLNPGAAGQEGFHKFRTLLRFVLDDGKMTKMEVVELGKRGKLQ